MQPEWKPTQSRDLKRQSFRNMNKDTHLTIGSNVWLISPRNPGSDGNPRLAFACVSPGSSYGEHGVIPTDSIEEVRDFLINQDNLAKEEARKKRIAKDKAAFARRMASPQPGLLHLISRIFSPA